MRRFIPWCGRNPARAGAFALLAWSLAAGPLPGAGIPIDPPAAAESGMPFLTQAPNGKLYLSWIDMLGGKDHAFRFAQWTGNAWTKPETIAQGNNWFVNWADVPSLVVLGDGSMLAHWLTRAEGGGKFGYGIRVARRAAQSPQWTEIHGMSLKETEDYAGFLTFLPGEAKAVFLSPPSAPAASHAHGASGAPEHGGHAEHRKTLRFIAFSGERKVAADVEVDADTCSCCPTAMARTRRGLIAAYRDHQGEVRDISIIRQVNGQWTKPASLHADGWKINGCPTDGPSLATSGDTVAVAWLTRAGDVPKVQLARSTDGGAAFGEPVRLDAGNPLGRPAVVADGKGGFVVLWLEKTGGEENEIRLRRLPAGGKLSEPATIARVPAGRLSGFPRLAVAGGSIVVAWRDQRVRAAMVPLTQ